MIEAKNEEIDKDFCGADDIAQILTNIVHTQYLFQSNGIIMITKIYIADTFTFYCKVFYHISCLTLGKSNNLNYSRFPRIKRFRTMQTNYSKN